MLGVAVVGEPPPARAAGITAAGAHPEPVPGTPSPAAVLAQTNADPTRGDSAGAGRAAAPPDGRILVREIVVEGNTAFDDARLREAVTGAYEGRWLGNADLQAMRAALTRFYVAHGYLTSGAVLPDQTVRDGIVRVRVIEGALGGIDVTGERALHDDWIAARVRDGLGTPLHAGTLFGRLAHLQEHAAVDRVDARLVPGDAPGVARLALQVTERPAWQAGLAFANDRAPGVGENRFSLIARHRSLTGRGDPLALRVGLGRTVRDAGLEYLGDPGADGWHLRVLLERSSAAVVEAPFDALDIRSRTGRGLLELRRELQAAGEVRAAVGIGLEARHTRTWLLGEPFSFSPGSENGRARSGAVQIAYEWESREIGRALALRTALRVGIDAFGATTNPDAPDTHFHLWQGQLQSARRLSDPDTQLVLRLAAQYSDDPLLPMEQFAIGGIDSVRGYRENRLIRDTGLAASAELRHGLGSFGLPWMAAGDRATLQAVGFVDIGRAGPAAVAGGEARWLRSVGIGLRLLAPPGLAAEVFVAHALDDAGPTANGTQDRGIHLRVSLSTP